MTEIVWAEPDSVPPGMKRCNRCKEFVSVDQFGKNKRRKDGLQAQCSPCRVLTNTESYERTKSYQNPKRLATSAAQVSLNQEIVRGHLMENPCVDCGETDIVVLEFDHQRDKVANVSTLIRSGSVARLLAEIRKCEVVCANCHKRRTARSFGWWRMFSHIDPAGSDIHPSLMV